MDDFIGASMELGRLCLRGAWDGAVIVNIALYPCGLEGYTLENIDQGVLKNHPRRGHKMSAQ